MEDPPRGPQPPAASGTPPQSLEEPGIVTSRVPSAFEIRERASSSYSEPGPDFGSDSGMDRAPRIGGEEGLLSRRSVCSCPEFPVELVEEDLALQSNTEAVFNLLNNGLGVSILSVGYTFKLVGIGFALVLYLISAYINRYTMHLVFRSCQLAGVRVSYAEVAQFCLGQSGYVFVSLCVFLQCYSMNVAYVVTISQVMDDFSHSLFDSSVPALWGCVIGTAMLSPFTMVRSMRGVAIVSAIATAAALCETVLVSVPCLSDLFSGVTAVMDEKTGQAQEPGPVIWYDFSIDNIITTLPMALLSYANQGSAPIILAALQDGSWKNVKRITGISYLIITVIILLFGASVYLRYTDLTTNNSLTTIGHSNVFQLARFSGLILVFVSYIFMMVPTRHIVMYMILGKDEVRQEASYETFAVVTMVLNLSACICAAIAMNFGGLSLVLRFSGGVCATSLALIVPPMLFISVRSARGWDTRVVCGHRGGLGLIGAIGAAVFVISNGSLVMDLLNGTA